MNEPREWKRTSYREKLEKRCIETADAFDRSAYGEFKDDIANEILKNLSLKERVAKVKEIIENKDED